MGTMKDVAKATGLSVYTISKYINGGNVKEQNKILIDKAIKEVGFRVNSVAKALKMNKTKIIGVLIPSLDSLFTGTIISEVESVLLNHDYGMIVCDCREDEELEYRRMEFILDRMVDGIIHLPFSTTGEHIKLAQDRNVPIVLIDRMIDGINCDVVLVDNIGASYSAVEHLIAKGHRKIALISGSPDIFTHRERIIGYKRALTDYGIEYDDSLVKYGNCDIDSGFNLFKDFWYGANRPTAIYVTNYTMTLGVVMAANELSLNFPQDISLMGFDNIELAKLVKPSLSLVMQPMNEMGKAAAEILLKRVNNDYSAFPIVKRLKTKLIINNSISEIK